MTTNSVSWVQIKKSEEITVTLCIWHDDYYVMSTLKIFQMAHQISADDHIFPIIQSCQHINFHAIVYDTPEITVNQSQIVVSNDYKVQQVRDRCRIICEIKHVNFAKSQYKNDLLSILTFHHVRLRVINWYILVCKANFPSMWLSMVISPSCVKFYFPQETRIFMLCSRVFNNAHYL